MNKYVKITGNIRNLFSIFFLAFLSFFITIIYNHSANAYGISGKVGYGFGEFKNSTSKWDVQGKGVNPVIVGTEEPYVIKYDKASVFSILMNLSLPLIPLKPELEISRVVVQPTNTEAFSLLNSKNTTTAITINSENLTGNTFIVNFTVNPVFIDFFIIPYAGLGFGTGFFHYYKESNVEKRLMQAIAGATISINDDLFVDIRYKILSSFSNLDFYFSSTDPTTRTIHLNMPFLIKNILSISLGYKF